MLRALVLVLLAVEAAGKWPNSVGLVIVCLLSKPDGGWRPIGLMPTLVRLWMRARLDVARAWQLANERPFFYASAGKGAIPAAWKQAAWAELAATARGLHYATVLLDLVKAFERIPNWFLIQQAGKYGYNMVILRLSLAAYRLGRTVGVDGVFVRA